ncbi:MAG: tetratricopeptide repeat protein, partial [Acidobacteria bacterium]|nr:tetratricopeptide repeat protein [Acidobacteriota bacterium]
IGGLIARSTEAARTRRALAEAEQVRDFMVGLFEGADPERKIGESLTVRELLDQGTERLRSELTGQPLTRARFLQTLGAMYTKLGELGLAAEVVREALELRREHRPPGHPEIVESESELGVIYRRLGRLAEAEPLLRSVLSARQADPDVDPELLARAFSNLGNLRWSRERFEEAEALHRQALALRRENARRLATDQALSDEAISANNLGVMLLGRRRYSEARTALERAVVLFRAQDHALLGSALNNLGMAERELTTWERAEGLFREAIEVHEATVGPAHDRPLRSHRSLIHELLLRHRFDEAVAEGRQAAAQAETLDDAGHLAYVLLDLGFAQLRSGRLEDAAATMARSVTVSTEALGAEHPVTLRCRGHLAWVRAKLGQVEDGLAALEEVDR